MVSQHWFSFDEDPLRHMMSQEVKSALKIKMLASCWNVWSNLPQCSWLIGHEICISLQRKFGQLIGIYWPSAETMLGPTSTAITVISVEPLLFQLTCNSSVGSTVCSDLPQMEYQSPHYWPFIQTSNWRQGDFLHKRPIIWKVFPCHGIIMSVDGGPERVGILRVVIKFFMWMGVLQWKFLNQSVPTRVMDRLLDWETNRQTVPISPSSSICRGQQPAPWGIITLKQKYSVVPL